MKTFTKITALAAALFATTTCFSQTIQYIQITVTENSNLQFQQPVNFQFSFSANGNDSTNYLDVESGPSTFFGNYAFPFTYTASNDLITALDSRPTLTGYRAFPMGFATKDSAQIKIVTTVYSNNGDTTDQPEYVWLEKLSTGEIWQLNTDTLKLDLDANDTYQMDYVVHTGPRVQIDKTDETCWDSNNGTIHITNPNCTNWNFTLYQNAIALFTSNVAGNDTLLTNLDGGVYWVVTRVGNNIFAPIDSSKAKIFSPSPVIADFSVSDNYPVALSQVDFYDASTGANTYAWNFGDGNTDNTPNPSHQYSFSGNYEVTLTVTDVNGCQSSTWDSVWVQVAPIAQQPHFLRSNVEDNSNSSSDPTLRTNNTSNITVATGEQKIAVNYTGEEKEMTIDIMNTNGQLVATYVTRSAANEFAVPTGGVYLVRITSLNDTITRKILVK